MIRKQKQTVAAVFALLNDFLLSKNKKSLGFINPLIYSQGSTALTDIVSGSNPGCGTNGKLICLSYAIVDLAHIRVSL
jgi:hypothetical protein